MNINNEIVFTFYTIFLTSAALFAYKFLPQALYILIAIQSIFVNIFVVKEIKLFGFIATASDALAISIPLCLNLISEKYSKKDSKKALSLSFFSILFYFVIINLHNAYQAVPSDFSVAHFEYLAHFSFRVIFVSIFSFFISDFCDIELYNFLRQKIQNLAICSLISISISQFLDTVIFSFFALYKLNGNFNNINAIFSVILISYLVKLTSLIISTIVTHNFSKFSK